MKRAIALAFVLLVTSFATVAADEQAGFSGGDDQHYDECHFFEPTDKYVCDEFLAYWLDFGGLEIFGYPITGEIEEDDKTVQYFERARLELHPGVWPERHNILQGLLGAELTVDMRDLDPFQPAEPIGKDCEYHDLTGHNVCDQFLDRWQMSGGLPVFGHPISEAFEDEDGMLVQYFERQRMEYQPGVWPERHDVLLGLLGIETLHDPPPPPHEPAPEPELTVIADDLVQPRGVHSTIHAIYVAEAGAGGDGECIMLGSGVEGCFGESSALTRIDADGQHRIVDGVASLIEETGEGIGIHDIAFGPEGELYAVIGLGADPTNRPDLGPDAELLGTVIHISHEGDIEMLADLAAFEEAVNPDETLLDSNPYGMAFDGEALIVADAGGNNLLRVHLDGEIENIAVLPERMVEGPGGAEMPMESVPTNVAVGDDGNYYVSELTGFPFPVGGAQIYQVTPDGDVSVYAEGFTNLGDLAFDYEGNLWALEIVAGGLLNIDPDDPSTLASRIVKIAPDGEQTEYMLPELAFATGIDVGPEGEVYVSNLAVTPDAHLARIDIP